MSSGNLIGANPFADSDISRDSGDDATLTVGRSASLTLGTGVLIVLDEGFTRKEATACCGLTRDGTKTTRAIPFFNILWAELLGFDIVIEYAHPTSRDVVRVATIDYLVEKSERNRAAAWITELLDRSYRKSQRNKRIKVLINPHAGQGSAQKWYTKDIEPIFTAAHCDVDVERTLYQGHGVEIAEQLDTDAYDVVASCSGDGLPHEVFNGLGRKQDARRSLSKIAVVQLPCGSGNAMSWNLNGTDSTSMAALCIVKGVRIPLDLISITQGETRTLSFLSQSVGIVAESDLGTEHLRWLGDARFTYGFLVRLLRKTIYPCDVAVKCELESKAEVKDHYRRYVSNRLSTDDDRANLQQASDINSKDLGLPPLQYGSILDGLPVDWTLMPYDKLGNFFAGNMAYIAAKMPFFPATIPNDGCLDLVTIDGDISRSSAIQSMLAIEKGKFFDMPHVRYRKITGYRIIPRGQKDGYISIDGERAPFAPFQAEVHAGLGTVLSKSGHLYECDGVS